MLLSVSEKRLLQHTGTFPTRAAADGLSGTRKGEPRGPLMVTQIHNSEHSVTQGYEACSPKRLE